MKIIMFIVLLIGVGSIWVMGYAHGTGNTTLNLWMMGLCNASAIALQAIKYNREYKDEEAK